MTGIGHEISALYFEIPIYNNIDLSHIVFPNVECLSLSKIGHIGLTLEKFEMSQHSKNHLWPPSLKYISLHEGKV